MGGQPAQSVRTTKNFYFGDVVKKSQFGKDLIVVNKPILNREEY